MTTTQPCPRCKGTGKIEERTAWAALGFFSAGALLFLAVGGWRLWSHDLGLAIAALAVGVLFALAAVVGIVIETEDAAKRKDEGER